MLTPKQKKQLSKGPFSYQDAVRAGINKYALKKYLGSGTIEKLGRGIYRLSTQDDDFIETRYSIATIRCGLPCCVCLISALEHYQLTDQIPKQTWIIVPVEKRVRDKELRLIRSPNPHWTIGIKKTKHYWITTLERTLIDCLIHKKLIGTEVGLQAMKQAINEKKVKPGTLYDLAKRMGVEHRVQSYLEAFSL